MHTLTLRTYYKDTDAEGVVYYANYLAYFEAGRMEYFRDLGISIKELKENFGVVFAVRNVECDYLAPALLDDQLTISTEVETIEGVRVIFKQSAALSKREGAQASGQTLVSGVITLVALDYKTFKPVRIPPPIMDKVKSK